MEKQFIFLDIDGTLIDPMLGYMLPSTLNALKQARANNHELFICSGRAYAELDEQMRSLDVSGMILCSGAHILVNDETLYHAKWNNKDLQKVIDYMNTHELGFSLEGLHNNFMNHGTFEMFRDHLIKNDDINIREATLRGWGFKHYHEMQPDDLNQILKISIFSNKDKEMHTLLNQLPDTLTGLFYDKPVAGLFNAEIMIKGCNKSSGIDYLLNHFNHPLSQTLSIGDGLNDLDMLEHTAIGICMGNGSELLKEKADFITKDLHEDGFAYAFKHFDIIEEY